jgi:hypothetical protein
MGEEVRAEIRNAQILTTVAESFVSISRPLLFLCFFLQSARFPKRSALICPEEDPALFYKHFLHTVYDTRQAEITPLRNDGICVHPATRDNASIVNGAHVKHAL